MSGRELGRLLLLSVVCLAAVPVLTAQGPMTEVLPPEAATNEGNAISTHMGFDQVRFVQAFGETYVDANRVITELAWRRDGQYRQHETIEYSWWHKENEHAISIALVPLDRSTLATGLFPESTAKRRVFARERVVLPDLVWEPSATQPFEVRFKFDVPYVTTSRGLMIDVVVDHPKWNDWTAYALDAVRREHGIVSQQHFGSGPLHIAPTVGDQVSVHVFGGLPQVPAMWVLGASPLAGPLLLVDPLVVVTALTRSTGSLALDLPFVPWTSVLVQCLQFFPTTSSPGLVLEMRDPPLDAWIVQATGYSKNGDRGLIERNTMIVTELR